MIVVYFPQDVELLLDKYIQHREVAGLSREAARAMALSDVKERVTTKKALQESAIIEADEQTRLIDATKKVTDRLSTLPQ